MKKEFSISNDKVLMNFSTRYCNNFESLLESEGFRRVLSVYLKKSEKKRRFLLILEKVREIHYYSK